MFSFPQIDPETSGQVTRVPVPLEKYLSASFRQGFHDSAFNSVMRMTEVHIDEASTDFRMLSPDEANERYAVGDLKFDRPIRESTAITLNERKRAEMDREFFLSNGFSGTRFVAGLPTMMAGNLLNPLDFALLFVPVVGEERLAATLAKSGAGALRQALARGLVTREAIAASGVRAPKFLASVIHGVGGQAVFEVPVLLAARQDQSHYGMAQSLINLAGAGALAAGIHAAAAAIRGASQVAQEVMARAAMNDFVKGDDIRVDHYLKLDQDDHVLRFRAEQKADRLVPSKVFYHGRIDKPGPFIKQGELTAAGMYGDTVNALWVAEDIKTAADFVEMAAEMGDMGWSDGNKNLITAIELPKRGMLVHDAKGAVKDDILDEINALLKKAKEEGKAGVIFENLVDTPGSKRSGTIAAIFNPEKQKIQDFELRESDYTEGELSSSRLDEIKQAVTIAQEAQFAKTRQKAINDFLRRERAKAQERINELETLVREGRTLTDDEMRAYTHGETIAKEDVAAMEREVGQLEEELGVVKVEKPKKGKPKKEKPTFGKDTLYHSTLDKDLSSFLDDEGNLHFKVMNPTARKGELGTTFTDDLHLASDYYSGTVIIEIDRKALDMSKIHTQGGNEWIHKWDQPGDLVIPKGKWKLREPRTVDAVAVKTPEGKILTGSTHIEILADYISKVAKREKRILTTKETDKIIESMDQGFLDSNGKFVDRDEAARISGYEGKEEFGSAQMKKPAKQALTEEQLEAQRDLEDLYRDLEEPDEVAIRAAADCLLTNG